MDLSSLNQSLNIISNKVKTYLDNPVDLTFADYQQQLDIKYISNQYSEIVNKYSELLKLITEVQYFVSQCKKVLRLIPDNTSLEKAQKSKVKIAIDMANEAAEPLYNERERLKTIEMFYRSVYTRRDF